MDIEILQLVEGARRAEGLTVIIDVFRACSLSCYLIDRGAEKIIPVGETSHAFLLREKFPEVLLAGERNNSKVPGFDFGNSPFEILDARLDGRTIIHTTSAGTQGMVNATSAQEIITGSFVNAMAVIKYIEGKRPDKVSLVCMGYAALHPTEEDTFCARYIKTRLEGGNPDFNEMTRIIKETSGRRFFQPETQSFCPKEDFDLCLSLDAFDFVIRMEKDEVFGMSLKKYVP